MNITRKIVVSLREALRLEELGRANIALPDGLYVFPSESALSSSWPTERRHDGGIARGSIRAALGSILNHWTSNRRPRR